MKKITIKIFPFLVGVISLTSCVKEADMNIDPGKTNSVIEFANTGDNQAGNTSEFPRFYTDLGSIGDGESASFNVNVNYAGGAEAPEDITVNLAIDAKSLETYNTEDGTDYVVPATSIFSIPSSVVIKKGTRLTQVQAKITRTSDFDFGLSYALPVKIASVSSGTISGNFGTAIYSFGVRNQYDGHYSIKGYTLRSGDAVKTGNFTDSRGIDLATVGSTSNQFGQLQPWADLTGVGVGYPVIAVNADNSVTLTSSGGIANAPGYNSHYDPTSKTYFISFTWGAGPSARLATDTLTYIGPR